MNAVPTTERSPENKQFSCWSLRRAITVPQASGVCFGRGRPRREELAGSSSSTYRVLLAVLLVNTCKELENKNRCRELH